MVVKASIKKLFPTLSLTWLHCAIGNTGDHCALQLVVLVMVKVANLCRTWRQYILLDAPPPPKLQRLLLSNFYASLLPVLLMLVVPGDCKKWWPLICPSVTTLPVIYPISVTTNMASLCHKRKTVGPPTPCLFSDQGKKWQPVIWPKYRGIVTSPLMMPREREWWWWWWWWWMRWGRGSKIIAMLVAKVKTVWAILPGGGEWHLFCSLPTPLVLPSKIFKEKLQKIFKQILPGGIWTVHYTVGRPSSSTLLACSFKKESFHEI